MDISHTRLPIINILLMKLHICEDVFLQQLLIFTFRLNRRIFFDPPVSRSFVDDDPGVAFDDFAEKVEEELRMMMQTKLV